jgi:class 3 adenylate cyclase
MSTPVTFLFTDLLESTELVQRVGDARAQRLFQAHHRLLKDTVAAHGGQEVKLLGDGLLTVFASAADAVRAAVAMQRAARRRAAGERLALRVGLHAGEAPREETDYFGAPVVITRRLCAQAQAGQILTSGGVVGLLAGRQAFRFAEVGALALKGLATPITAYEVPYQQDEPAALLTQTPFVGRTAELSRLGQRLRNTHAGQGGVVLLEGEAGIGKTRTLEELAETARAEGTTVLWGRCYEGEASRPYGPFAEALTEYARRAPVETLRADLGVSATALTRFVPELRERLPDLTEPVALQPDEERVRLLDAVVQCLLAIAARAPAVVMVLDDLHWADHGTVAMLRHVGRFVRRGRLLVLGAYRDVEIDGQHPLRDALGALPRETSYEQIALDGLDTAAVHELLALIADQKMLPELVTAVTQETSGNPFFIREVLLHLVEEGALVRGGGGWNATVAVEAMRIPDTVRQVIERRLGRLGEAARRLLDVAALFTETVRFDIAARVAGLEESSALDGLDEVLAAQLLKSTADPDAYEFTHALVRHTLYGALNSSRRVRLHRQIAEAMELGYGTDAERYAGELARQYHRSAALPGAERGVAYCVAAADRAERAGALEEVADALAMALALLPADDARRRRLLARRGLALASTKRANEAAAIAIEAAELVAVSDGHAAAASYLAEVAIWIFSVGTAPVAWAVARHGLIFTEGRRDFAWATLRAQELDRLDVEDPEHPGIVVDTPERREIAQFSPVYERDQDQTPGSRTLWFPHWDIFESRQAALAKAGPARVAQIFQAGVYSDALPHVQRFTDTTLERGELDRAAQGMSTCSRLHSALGDLAAAERDLLRFTELAKRAGNSRSVVVGREMALFDIAYCRGTGLELGASAAERFLARDDPGMNSFRAATHALAAVLYTFAGRDQDALRAVARAMPAIERAGGGVLGYTALICRCCEALWRLGCTDFADVLERNLLAKTVAGDFREPGVDARLAMAHLCALTGRPGEAHDWFDRARAVLDEQGARPLRALVDLDEAWMEIRRGAHGDRDRARALLDVACEQFQAIGMSGWIERAEALRAQSAESAVGRERLDAVADSAASSAGPRPPATDPASSAAALFRHEGDFWTLAYQGTVCRVKDAKGLHYIAHLLRHPGREFHVLDLIGRGPESRDQRAETGQGVPILDAPAKAAYQQRLSELRDELDEAERFNDPGRAERAREEMEAIAEQLAAAVGLGGRDRQAGSSSERARSTMTKAVKAALTRIGDHHAALGRHLTTSIRTGTFCSYAPDQPPAPWAF